MSEDGIAAAYDILFEGLDQFGPTTSDARMAVLDLIRDRLPEAPAVASLLLAKTLPAAAGTGPPQDTRRPSAHWRKIRGTLNAR